MAFTLAAMPGRSGEGDTTGPLTIAGYSAMVKSATPAVGPLRGWEPGSFDDPDSCFRQPALRVMERATA